MRIAVGEWVMFVGSPDEPLLRAIGECAGIGLVIGTTDDGRYVLEVSTPRGTRALRGIVVSEDYLQPRTPPAWAL